MEYYVFNGFGLSQLSSWYLLGCGNEMVIIILKKRRYANKIIKSRYEVWSNKMKETITSYKAVLMAYTSQRVFILYD